MNFKKLMKPYYGEMISALIRLVNIDSTYDPKTISKGKPFGEGIYNALQFVGNLGERFGFDVDYCDGYATELSIGEGKKLISIFAHVDVVPISGVWKYSPFNAKIVDNKIYGRGTSDDKGPLIASFFAIKALKDNDLLTNYRVKLVVGGDEERNSEGLDYYFKKLKKEEPLYGFTPDSDFPLIYGEKAISPFEASFDLDLGSNISKIEGGIVRNAVCDSLKIIMTKDVKFLTFLATKNYKYSYVDDETTHEITISGKSAHGSTPQKGINAGIIALKAIGEFYKLDQVLDLALKLEDPFGKGFDGYFKSKELGVTTYNYGIFNYQNKKLTISVDFRHGEGVDSSEYIDNFKNKLKADVKILNESPFLLIPKNSKFVKTLLKAYRRETFDFSKPLTTGGGTYAKHAKNTLAFGAMFPYSENVMHEPNEYFHLDDLKLSSSIYARAIYLLGNLNENKI